MKKVFQIMALAALFVVASASLSSAQCVLSGCFGACGGSSYSGSFVASQSGSYSVNITNSLCGSEGVVVRVQVGNRRINRHVGPGGGSVEFDANAGQTVSVYVENWRTDPNIVCVWQGEVNIDVCPNF